MADVVDILSFVLMSAGVFFMLSGALGILRMPDFFTRLHPAGVVDSFGSPLLLLGVSIQYGMSFAALKILLLVLINFITGPTATHALAQCALFGKLKPIQKGKK